MRILVVEDDILLGDAIQVGMTQAGYAVDWIRDGVQADQALSTEPYAAAILDLGLPGLSGLEILRNQRSRVDLKIPILILTARDTVDDRIKGLDSGADDYLVKPFDMNELAARVRALIRRAGGFASSVISVAGIELDPAAHTVKNRGEGVDLSGREFTVLQALMLNAGKVMTRTQLEDRLYAWGNEVESNTIEVHIHHLRRKLGTDLIKTIRGVGYLIPLTQP